MVVHWKIWIFRGERVHELKAGGGGGRGWKVCRFKRIGGLGKKKGCSLHHFGRQGACNDITKSADSQTKKKIFRQWLLGCRNSTKTFYQTNDFRIRIWGNEKVFEKTQFGWRQMLVASHSSRNRFLVTTVKIYTEADFKVS